ncbi:MAG TPA: hypothetical protein VNO35_33065, partial [Steroidobacteraceae bacterium]|nr:hypothetical protein [Steroidobacteraceae bacterium]
MSADGGTADVGMPDRTGGTGNAATAVGPGRAAAAPGATDAARGAALTAAASDSPTSARVGNPGPPLWLLCELTYTCPLHCVFCYNPTDFAKTQQELSTDDWIRVLRQGREL